MEHVRFVSCPKREGRSDLTFGTPIDLGAYDVPGRGKGVLDVFRRRYLLRLLVRKGTATRYRNSVLGWVWSYVKPASQFLIYYFVMGIILNFHRDIENFPIYLFSGVVAVNLFNEAFGNATTSIVDNRALVKKIYLPRELFPVAAIIVAFVHFLPQLAILIVVCLLIGWTPTVAGIGGAILGLILIVAFALGLGLFFSALNARFRDAQNFVELIKMFSTWTSPVLYTWAMVYTQLENHPWIFTLYSWNPLTVAVELFHQGFWASTTADSGLGIIPGFGTALLVAGIICVSMLIVGQLVFRNLERSFAQDL
ncbi:ABC-2 type transport system permease protein [Microbacterium ginsengiterrae]|uniref:Transport permease protein n=1 Tax=Microbacterium ginsengiterrae TaxID=546115 RepID=A0A7W9CDP3_9MICO|nr:ABC-2 type transport system permease protein [Microbacterium ginsengiterrae]